jgi:hypothetical protein
MRTRTPRAVLAALRVPSGLTGTPPQGEWVAPSPPARRPPPRGSPEDRATECRRAQANPWTNALSTSLRAVTDFCQATLKDSRPAPTLASASRGEPKSALKMAYRVFPRAADDLRPASTAAPVGSRPGHSGSRTPFGTISAAFGSPLADERRRPGRSSSDRPLSIGKAPHGARTLGAIVFRSSAPETGHVDFREA